MSCKNFNDSWIKGSENPTSDAVKKHVTSEMHKRTADLALKKEVLPRRYADIDTYPIGKTNPKMNQKARKVLKNRFTAA